MIIPSKQESQQPFYDHKGDAVLHAKKAEILVKEEHEN